MIIFSNVNLINGEEEQEDCESSISTKITVPLDYDTDILQKELTTFGIKAGPITKSTKRVYLRQLVKFKKNPDRAKEHVEQVTSDNISKLIRISMMNHFRSIKLIRKFVKHNCMSFRLKHLWKSDKFYNLI